MITKISIAIIFVLLILTAVFMLKGNSKTANMVQNKILDNRPEIVLNDKKIKVELADTNEKRQNGLSGRRELGDDEGMLFIFETKAYPIFWMKDMLIPLDLIWISDGEIVQISKDAPVPQPGTQDKDLFLYRSQKMVDYVLEMNAGFSDKNSLSVGTKVDLSNLKK